MQGHSAHRTFGHFPHIWTFIKRYESTCLPWIKNTSSCVFDGCSCRSLRNRLWVLPLAFRLNHALFAPSSQTPPLHAKTVSWNWGKVKWSKKQKTKQTKNNKIVMGKHRLQKSNQIKIKIINTYLKSVFYFSVEHFVIANVSFFLVLNIHHLVTHQTVFLLYTDTCNVTMGVNIRFPITLQVSALNKLPLGTKL